MQRSKMVGTGARVAVAGLAAAALVAGAGAPAWAWGTGRQLVGDAAPTARITTANGMAITGAVSVAFSEAVTGVTPSSLRLFPVGGSNPVPSRVSVKGTVATLRPASPLVPGMTYRLSVTSTVRDGRDNIAVASTRTVRTSRYVVPGSKALVQRWDPDSTSNAYGGTYGKSATPMDSTSLSFTGTSVALDGVRSTSGGYAHVYLDNVFQGTVDFYAPSTQWRARVWSSRPGSMWPGRHTVKLVVVGAHRAASRGSWVYVDRWVTGVWATQEGTAAGSAARDAWSQMVATDATGGAAAAESANARYLAGGLPSVGALVAGTGVTVKLCKGPTSGGADVYVDGVKKATATLYQSYTRCGVTAYSGPLGPGAHAVQVLVTGAVPAGSKGSRVGFDSFVLR